jgi:hypothetical protein
MRFSLKDTSPAVEFEDLARSVFGAPADVADFRKARGRRLDIGGVLALIVPGPAAGQLGFPAIAAFGRRREADLIPKPPSPTVRRTSRRDADGQRGACAGRAGCFTGIPVSPARVRRSRRSAASGTTPPGR